MSHISFDDLYGSDKPKAQALVATWANDYLGALQVSSLKIDDRKLLTLVSNLRSEEFPANGGFADASPFKKAANIYVYLHAINPFIEPLPATLIGPHMARYQNNTATIIGFNLVKTCLKGACLTKRNGERVVLAEEIAVSDHFLGDLVEASSEITVQTHFKVYSLLFESLAYRANPTVSYPSTF